MNVLAVTAVRPVRHGQPLPGLWRELWGRQPLLTLFGAVLLALLLPLALAAGFDERLLRGANVWWKPMKFALSIAVFALTTAWFIGHLPAARRSSRAVRWVVGLVVGAGSFEFLYIALQAGLGAASHYNETSVFHAVMYALMGVGALLLTASQPMLAWQLHRHPQPALAPAYRLAVTTGLLLTFVLGAGVGLLLSAYQPPSGAGLPLLGWSTTGGDLRPAHFLGIHAQQLLPLAGLALARLPQRLGRPAVLALVMLYVLACAGLVVYGMAGRAGG